MWEMSIQEFIREDLHKLGIRNEGKLQLECIVSFLGRVDKTVQLQAKRKSYRLYNNLTAGMNSKIREIDI